MPGFFPGEALGLVTQVSQPPGDTHHVAVLSQNLDSGRRDLQRLISGDVPQDELVSIVSNMKPTAIVGFLQGGDARVFIEMMDKV